MVTRVFCDVCDETVVRNYADDTRSYCPSIYRGYKNICAEVRISGAEHLCQKCLMEMLVKPDFEHRK